jgi:hypothetical protein
MTNKYLYFTLLAVLGLNVESYAQQTSGNQPPRLVVSITIDQLRTDYLEAFAPLYSDNGFRRLLDEGLVYTRASYPFSPIDRASAIATLSTGVTPYYNNIVGMRWLDRQTLRPTWCVDDKKYSGVGTTDCTSPIHLTTSTVGDELKVETDGKSLVYAIAPNRDAAILSAGHAANGAVWIDDSNGLWCTTQFYTTGQPAWVQVANNGENAPANKIDDLTWEPVNELVGNFSYFMRTGLQKPFKHKFSGLRRFEEFKASAMVNTAITDMAAQCVAGTNMGNDRITDMLCLTYYAGNYDHRTLTECLIEIQDTYVRLDQELSRLFRYLEERVGKANILYVVTSTGYSDQENADYQKYRIPTGTFYMSRTSNLLNMYLGAIWGQGKYVEAHFKNQIFLNHQLLEQKKISIAEASNRSQEFLAMLSGVRNVYTSLQLLTASDEYTRKIRNGFNPERCGDLLIEAAPGWRLLDEDTQEQELVRASFIQFPIIFYGAGTTKEKVTIPVTTDRIAPTIARAIRIRAPNACSSEPLF